jgi:hypothetical protein
VLEYGSERAALGLGASQGTAQIIGGLTPAVLSLGIGSVWGVSGRVLRRTGQSNTQQAVQDILSVENHTVMPPHLYPDTVFKTDEIFAIMNNSAIGRRVTAAANKDEIVTIFAEVHHDTDLLGYMVPGNPNRAYTIVRHNMVFDASTGALDRIATLNKVADNAVHEGLHGLGISGSWQAELQVRALTFEHRLGRIPTNMELANLELAMRTSGRYDSLPKFLNQTIEILPGRFISF